MSKTFIALLLLPTLASCSGSPEGKGTASAVPSASAPPLASLINISPDPAAKGVFSPPALAMSTDVSFDELIERWNKAATAHGLKDRELKELEIKKIYQIPTAVVIWGEEAGLSLTFTNERKLVDMRLMATLPSKDTKASVVGLWETMIDVLKPGQSPEERKKVFAGLGLFDSAPIKQKTITSDGLVYTVATNSRRITFHIGAERPAFTNSEPFGLAIPAGRIDKNYMPPYKLQRIEGASETTFLNAMKGCIDKGMVLCTDTQLTRACIVEPKIGTIATWTSSGTPTGKVLVQGGGTCETRKEGDFSTGNETHLGLCCTPSVAVIAPGGDPNYEASAIEAIAASPIVALQTAINAHDSLAIEDSLGAEVSPFFTLARTDRKTAAYEFAKAIKRAPDTWVTHTKCTVGVLDKRVVADCDKLTWTGRSLMGLQSRYWVGESNTKVTGQDDRTVEFTKAAK